jgi:hypothetical protein
VAGGEQRAGGVQRREHGLLRLAHGEPADRVAVEADADQALGRAGAQAEVGAALDDAEQAVAVAADEGRLRALGPAQGQLHGALDLGSGRRQGDALVEHHGDRGIQEMLDLDRALGRQLVPAAVVVRAEHHAALGELAALGQRHDLEPAAVGQDRPLPAHEAVQPAQPADALGPGAQHQVVGVAQDDLGAGARHHLAGHGLDRGGRADRHEGWGLDRAEGGGQPAAAGGAVAGQELEAETGHAASPARVRRQASP